MKLKRKLSAILACVTAAFTLTACSGGSNSSAGGSSADGSSGGSAASDSDTIKIGVLEDISGDNSLVGVQKYHGAQLAISEINAAGGINGKQVEMVFADGQSDNSVYQEMVNKFILEDNVDVIMGCYTSASREAVRPIVEENNALLFYNNQYEGGVASHNVFCTGAIPEHQITTLIEGMIDEYGPKAYIIAADYNFGQISTMWVEQEIEKNGGELVGEEFIPLEVSQFSSTIANIQAAQPDFLVTLLVGTAQSSFYEQWGTSGIEGCPMATTVNIAQGYEHKRFTPPALENMYVTATYVEELGTPASNDFKDRWHAMFPDEPYIGMEAESEYTGIYLYKAAVEKAGTTDVEEVIKALESGEISYDGPAGMVTVDGATHHAIRNVYLFKCNADHSLTLEKTWEAVKPDWLSSVKGIDLRESAPNEQYTPLD